MSGAEHSLHHLEFGLLKANAQVGFVTVICATCFTVRAVIVAWSALDKKDADLDVWQHPLLDFIYYMLVEIVPSALVRRPRSPSRVLSTLHTV